MIFDVAAKASDYSYLAPVTTSVGSTTDDEGRISTFSGTCS